jgi:hypothetical protein
MKKDKKQLLNEELSKFNKLLNYDYYDGKDSVNEMHLHGLKKSTDEGKELLYGGSTVEEAEEEETDPATPEAPVDEPAPEDAAPEDMPDPSLETGAPIPDMNPDANADTELPVDDTMPPADDAMAPEATDDESVDLDVTELVKGSQEAKASADEANAKIERLLGMVDKLENQLASMGQISDKIDGLEKELEKRVPTPDEKVELRSMDSYPYNIKLSDFWADHKDSPYDAGQDDEDGKDAEGNYVLTQDDVDNFDANNIKQSFNENPFEEEDV